MRILYVTTLAITMGFFKPIIGKLLEEGHTVDLACNTDDPIHLDFYREKNCAIHSVPFSRSPLARGNLAAARCLKEIIEKNNYDLVHCHTPVAAACTRLVCRNLRKRGTKVFYTAHGFHFFKGAPLKNWLIYFPVEWLCSFMTDTLITINWEDYALAKKHMHAKRVEHIPGVGIDTERYKNVKCDRIQFRHSIGVPEDAVVLLSVGELNDNKNHQVIIKAMSRLGEINNLHYVIAGEGPNAERLKAQAKELGLSGRVHLLGYRTDIPELNKASDIFCFPSRREGLGLAALEAMASGVPLVTSNVHGINDYSENGVTGFKCAPDDELEFAEAIRSLFADNRKRMEMGENVRKIVRNYDQKISLAKMIQIYDLHA